MGIRCLGASLVSISNSPDTKEGALVLSQETGRTEKMGAYTEPFHSL